MVTQVLRLLSKVVEDSKSQLLRTNREGKREESVSRKRLGVLIRPESPSGFAAAPGVAAFRLHPDLVNPAGNAVSAALAGLDDHVGELLHFGRPSGVVEDGQRLQVRRNAAGRGRGAGVQRVVQTQELRRNRHTVGTQSVSQKPGR